MMTSSPPPSYEQATGSGTPTARTDGDSNGIPPSTRRSMEDETRPLPKGWVRSFDPETSHQFFVDTTQEPPRAIWHHPYDDDVYINSLPAGERDRLAGQSVLLGAGKDDSAAENTSDDEAGASKKRTPISRPDDHPGSLERLGRKVKDRLTSSTHAEREADRRRRAQAEAEAHRQHLAFRGGLAAAMRTGQPQMLGRDEEGNDVFLEPPGLVPGSGVVAERRRLSPYLTEVRYAPGSGPALGGSGARFVRADGLYPGGPFNGALGPGYGGPPYGPYARPMGGRYGGGFGMPLALPLLGGVMLGGMMF